MPGEVGAFELRPAQRRAVRRILAAFDEFGGALLADATGTGKTIVALACARASRGGSREDVLVAAPAILRVQWHAAAVRAGVEIRFVSLEALSRAPCPPSLKRARLVIVDEAHQVRTPGTRRHSHLAATCLGAQVLLLSATPVVNRPADRAALLGLFLGARAATLDSATAARCIVRSAGDGPLRPSVRALAQLQGVPDVPGLAEMLRALPPPLPVSDGIAATPLVRISLAYAWSSSLVALDAALRRRVQRGDALADSLGAGRWPSRAALRQWTIGDDATQLAMPELFGAEQVVRADGPTTASIPAAIGQLRTHLDAVRAMRAAIRPWIAPDTTARAEALRSLLRAHPTRRLACFARHGDTVRALWSALRADAGVVAITGTRAYAAEGRWTRGEVLEALGPRAGRVRGDDRRAIRLLLTTDLLAEGVELQGISLLVHGDRTWTPARAEQREGRLVRIGASTPEVLMTSFRAPSDSVPFLRLGARLARKREARRLALAEADALARVDALVRGWRGVRLTLGARAAFIARVLVRGAGRVIGGTLRDGAWRVTDLPRRLGRIAAGAEMMPASPACAVTERVRIAAVEPIRRAIARWARRECARTLIVGRMGHDPSRLVARLRARIDRLLRATPFALREPRARTLERCLTEIAMAHGIGLESRLDRAARLEDDHAFEGALASLAAELGEHDGTHHSHKKQEGDPSRPRLVALLVCLPSHATSCANAPPPTAMAPVRT